MWVTVSKRRGFKRVCMCSHFSKVQKYLYELKKNWKNIHQNTNRYQQLWASLVAQLVKNLPALWEIWVRSLGGKIPCRRERLPTPVFWLGEFHGLYRPWSCKKSDTTKQFSLSLYNSYLWMVKLLLIPIFFLIVIDVSRTF